jgi:hypothetical protein
MLEKSRNILKNIRNKKIFILVKLYKKIREKDILFFLKGKLD